MGFRAFVAQYISNLKIKKQLPISKAHPCTNLFTINIISLYVFKQCCVGRLAPQLMLGLPELSRYSSSGGQTWYRIDAQGCRVNQQKKAPFPLWNPSDHSSLPVHVPKFCVCKTPLPSKFLKLLSTFSLGVWKENLFLTQFKQLLSDHW